MTDIDPFIHELSDIMPRLLREMPPEMRHALEHGHVLVVDHDATAWFPCTIHATELTHETAMEVLRMCERRRMPVIVRGCGDSWAVIGLSRWRAVTPTLTLID